jgi:DNA-binding NarL/FixJ family response regulator
MRVIVADDDVLLRAGLASLLERSGFAVAGQAGDAEEPRDLVRTHPPDLVIVAIPMPPTHTEEGLEAALAIPEEFPHELVSARRRDDPPAALRPREREVLALMAEARSNTGIARQLSVTEGTVEKHVHSILTKLALPEADDDHRRCSPWSQFIRRASGYDR